MWLDTALRGENNPGLGISSVIFDSSLTLLRHGDMTATINTITACSNQTKDII